MFRSPSKQNPRRKNCRGPSTQYLFQSTPMRGLSQTGSGIKKHWVSSVRLPGLPLLPRVRQRPNPSVFHSKSPLSSRNQRAKKERKRKRQQQGGPPAKRGAAAGLQTLRANEGHDDDDSDDDDEPPPLHVFFDIEAMQPQEQHVANFVVAETEDDPRPVRFKGEHCLRDFLEWADTLTQDDTRQVNVIAQPYVNRTSDRMDQGYDGYFLVNQCHSNNQIVKQIRSGCKLLQVQHDKIRFIDSLSFFQMPLAAFPKTFGLTELKKGYVPHKFNIPDHQEYVGPSRPLTTTCPKSCHPKDDKSLKRGTRNSATTKSSSTSKKNWWPTANRMCVY